MDLREQLQHTLGSSYTLERELGGGGMARVFVATETRLRRNVVVKVLTPDLAAGLSVERFEREIQLAASLQQANIVPVLSAGDMGGVPYYTMPYVEGESLRALLATRGARPISEVVSILHDVARALSYAHAHGVVHRDIKPDNVLLSHGAAVVTDFGIAKAISASRTAAREAAGDANLTQTGASIGTPAYMAPEQAAADPAIDHRADIYAFGCLAYELLTGHPPFAGVSLQGLMAAHLTETPKSVRELRVETPPPLASLVTRCLAKRAADRPGSANEILESLDSLGAVVTPNVADANTPRPTRTPGVRRLVLAIVAAVCVVLIVATVWWRGRGQLISNAASVDRSIAVLPLANLSGDPKNDYLGEGLAEEITNALAKAGLRVIGRASARVLVDRKLDPTAIAKQLGVANVLGGSVQSDGRRLRITMNLTSASDGAVAWSDKYERDAKEWFAVQDEIAHSVAGELRVALAGGAATTLARKETNDAEAHALYLQGLYQWNRRGADALRRAISLFEQAVQRDSNYARAYAGIGMAYVVLPVYADVSADEMTAKGVDAARHALLKDTALAEAHAVLGYAKAATFENAAAERSFARALSLDSSLATTHFWHALLLGHIGAATESIRELQRARLLDPASLVIQQNLARQLGDAHQYATADSVARAVVALDSTFELGLLTRALIQTEEGRFDEPIETLERLARQPNLRSSEKLGMLAYAYARAGRVAQARATLTRLPRDTVISAAASVAATLYALGDRDSAVAMFRRAVAYHDPWILTTAREARFDALRKDSRLTPLFAKIEAPQ
jgi:serine/threonine-protein kinase